MKPVDETALALRVERSLSPYEPTSYEQALAMAGVLAKAAGIATEEAFLKMATGAEYGIPAISALRMVDIIPGPNNSKQVGLRAQLMVALCLRAKGVCEYIRHVEGDDKSATWAAKRVGEEEQRETYTVEQAVRAGLIKDGGAWKKDPASQLIARASSRLARRVFPDLVGNIYTPDELRDLTAAQEPAPVQPLPGSRTPKQDGDNDKIRDAEFTEVESDETRIVRQLGGATTAAEVQAVAQEAVKIWPRERPWAVKEAHRAAKARIAAPSKEAPPRERQPGEEG